MSNQEQMMTTLLQATSELVQSTKQQRENIDVLIDQVGRLSELVTIGFADLKAGSERQEERLDRIAATAERQEQRIDRVAATAERQAESIAQLIAVVDRLVPKE
jgi:ABC-type transporter Mla subunit MlaD